MEPIKDNEEAVKAFGIHFATEMCKKILAHGISTLHIYTLNMDKSAIGILMVVSHFLVKVFFFFFFLNVTVDTGGLNNGADIAEPWSD